MAVRLFCYMSCLDRCVCLHYTTYYMDESLIIQKLVSLDEKISGIATQDSLIKLSDDITQALDDQLVILQRLD